MYSFRLYPSEGQDLLLRNFSSPSQRGEGQLTSLRSSLTVYQSTLYRSQVSSLVIERPDVYHLFFIKILISMLVIHFNHHPLNFCILI